MFISIFVVLSSSAITVMIVMKLRKWAPGYKRQCRTLYYECPVRMDNKVVLVTGANSGIGKETAMGLASLGAKVIMACRDMEKAEAAAQEIRQKTAVDPSLVSTVQLDLSDLDSVRNCGQKIHATESKIDVLINNAGVGVGHVETSKQNYDYIFAANHVGHFLLTHLLLDLLKKGSPSRIINVSSVRHFGIIGTPDFGLDPEPGSNMKYPGLTDYCMSKLAQIFHSNVLSEKLKEHGVVANSMHPGYVSSEIWNNNSNRRSVVLQMRIMGWIVKRIGRTPKDAAKTVIYMAADPALEKVSGQYFENVGISDQISSIAKDPELAKKMWDVSMEMCGLTKKVE